MQLLEDLKLHEDKFVQAMASVLDDLNDARELGNITEEEFVEMAKNVVDLQNLDDIADDVERITEIKTVIVNIKKVFSALSIII